MNYWLIAKYLGPVIVVVGLYFWHQGEVKETKQASYDAGYAAAEKVCTDETVPAAQKAEREVCRRNSEITEASNATDLAAKDAATARAMRMLDQLRRSYTATPLRSSGRPCQRTSAGSRGRSTRRRKWTRPWDWIHRRVRPKVPSQERRVPWSAPIPTK